MRPNLWNTDSITKVSIQLWSGSKLLIASGFLGLPDRKRGGKSVFELLRKLLT